MQIESPRCTALNHGVEQLLELLPDIALLVRGDGRIRGANAAALDAYGYSRDELLSLAIDDLVSSEDHHRPRREATDARTRFKSVHRRKDAGTFPVEVSTRGVTLDGARVVLSVIRDISDTTRREAELRAQMAEREQAIFALEASEHSYRSLINHLNIGVILSSPTDGSIRRVNPMMVQLTGYDSAQELLNLRPEQLWAEPEARRRFLERMARDGAVDGLEMMAVRKNGTVFPASISAVLLRTADGQPEQILGTVHDITERKQREHELSISEQKFSRAFHGSPTPCAISTLADGRFIDANEPFLQAAGYGRDELIGRTGAELQIWASPEQARELRELVHANGSVTGFECGFRRSSGEIGCALLSAALIDVSGAACLLIQAVDITRRKQIDQALRDSELRFRTAFEQAFVGIVHIDLQGHWLRFNQRFCDLVGYSREELQQLNFRDLCPPDELADDEAVLERFARGELREYALEKRHVRKDGSIIWAFVTSTLVHGEDGQPLYISVFLQDITEQKRAAEEFELVKTSIDRAPFAAYWMDANGHFIYVNDAGCRELGYTREEMLRMHVADVNPLSTPARWAEVYDTLKSKGSVSLQTAHRRRDGTILPVQITTAYVKCRDREYCLGFAIDITERVRAERERDSLQKRFEQAQRLESVGRLAGGVAHDFNNMLTIIQMSVQQALASKEVPAALRDQLSDIRNAATRSAELTRQLLAFARKQPFAPRVLDLNETVAGMLRMLRRLLGENLELVWRPAAQSWPVLMDPSQLDQILANLCVNARDAISDVGTVTIETSNRTLDEDFCAQYPGYVPGDYVQLSVVDNGCGMDAETQSHIFEPFFTTKGEGKGTGLGLPTVYGIVKQNNGLLSVSSAPQQGTTFTIYLPRYLESATTESERARAASAKSTRSGRETILVVEDEPAILKLITRVLARLGYAVLPTRNPVEALRTAKEHQGPIHLLLTDVVMPEMNGRELAQRLQAIVPQMRCVYMSGYTADVIARHGVLESGVSFLQKPFSVEDLTAKLEEVLAYDRVPSTAR